MKKVRFESPTKVSVYKMNLPECHSPRPFIEKQADANLFSEGFEVAGIKNYVSDPVERFECSNSIPYPMGNITNPQSMGHVVSDWSPSPDLDLSMLDASCYVPREPVMRSCDTALSKNQQVNERVRPLSSIENNPPPNVLNKDDGFFLRRSNLANQNLDINTLNKLNWLSLDKENNPKSIKAQYFNSLQSSSPRMANLAFKKQSLRLPAQQSLLPEEQILNQSPESIQNESVCPCRHCLKVLKSNSTQSCENDLQCCISSGGTEVSVPKSCSHNTAKLPRSCYVCVCMGQVQQPVFKTCNCEVADKNEAKPNPPNAVDKKAWAIQRYEEAHNPATSEIEKQGNIKEKREPTVADLFKIIKLQNEQLQLLQEKVDRFIASSNETKKLSASSAIQNVSNQSNPSISIGVMTSFEMIRTSTVINKEIVTQTTENAQIQCNRSQISIKEVVSKTPVMNFLDGIVRNEASSNQRKEFVITDEGQNGGANDEKTLNEMSLYNVQVDNATTPLMSPEHSLYLDVRDYSDSESSADQTHNGWTYYNKVMTHVNGMLQDSDMPSSASALYRNTRQHCMQMQIDKTNVSVTKRVTFGDDPFRPQPVPTPITDTSLKMNQLAAKYLKNGVPLALTQQYMSPPPPVLQPNDVSLATRNYMERHRILREGPSPVYATPQLSTAPMPRFLDVTALKQQPKLL